MERGQHELVPRRIDRHVVSLADPDCFEAEQYRMLRYVLEEKRVPSRGFSIAVCSPAAGDGKSLTALNLAAALAQATSVGVLLMDVDLRRESASLKASLRPGKTDGKGVTDVVLNGSLSLRHVARQLPGSNLSVVFTGTHAPAAPYEVLRSPRFGALLAEAQRSYDYVILDAPPAVPVSDSRVIAKQVDGVLMVVAAHRTPRSMLEEALNLMGSEKLLGIVFNGSDLMPRRYYGYYGYGKPTAKRGRGYTVPREGASRNGRRNPPPLMKQPR
ncbi:MAG: CpsD/CapB family tyrosine-protein kinase [Bacillota bacterium]